MNLPDALWQRAVKFGFRLLYHEFAFTYDLVSWLASLGDWRAWQRAALRFLSVSPGACVLEVAHGTANLQIDLRTVGLESVAIDLSPQMGRIARRKLLRHRIRPRLARARAQALPFPDEAFPAVVCTFPTAFIVDPRSLGELYRVLQPGGRLVIVPNGVITRGGAARWLIEWAYRATGQRARGSTASGDMAGSDTVSPRPDWLAEWSPDLVARFTAAGFGLRSAVVAARRSYAQVIIAEKPALPR